MTKRSQRETRAGRPRDEDVTGRVISATLRLLDERGVTGLRIDDVVRASGVAKTTIYRRWPSVTALVIDTMEEALGQRSLPETGDVVADLASLVDLLHRSVTRTPFLRALPLISLELMQQPELGDRYRERIITPVRDQGIRLVRAGVEQGIFRQDTDPALVVDTVAGPILYRWVVLSREISLDDLRSVFDLVMRSIRVPG